MNSEWMQVMLDEIERKKAEAQQALAELARRREESAVAQVPQAAVPDPPG